jgi:hypothetical protein
MKLELRNNKDFWAGLMFIGIGGLALVMAMDYRFGSTNRMGPGFFPVVLGGILILFGSYIVGMGLRNNEKIQGSWSPRALIMLPAIIILFGFLMEHAGFIPALVILGFGSAAAGKEFKFVEVLLLTALLTVLSVALFIWGLSMPYPLINI